MGANLSYSDLTDARLLNADLTGANLTGVIFSDANLTNVKLIDTILTGTNLLTANLTNVKFTDANLTDAILPNDFFYTIAHEIGIPKNPKDFIEPVEEGEEYSPRTQYSIHMENTRISMLGGKRGDLLKIRIGPYPPDPLPPLPPPSEALPPPSEALPPPPPSPPPPLKLIQIFSNYSNLSKLNIQKIDCTFQTLFSLGLRNIKTAKHDSIVVNKLGLYNKSKGVIDEQIETYIQQIFGLEKTNTRLVVFKIQTPNQIYEYLNTKLIENTCTILLFTYSIGFGHCVTAFKQNGKIYIFDPQRTNIYSNENIYLLKDNLGYIYPNINTFTVIAFNEVIESKPLIVDNCTLPIFVAGRKGRKTRNQRNQRKQRKTKSKKHFRKKM
jgi:uncharacterized protein YjbI with pentapeptide repeats